MEAQAQAVCERCGNWYDKPFVVRMHGDPTEHVFDSFECATDALAPKCAHCGCRVMGHGVEEEGRIFCCASCARRMGADHVADRGDNGALAGAGTTASPTRPPSDS